jgi:hypothetical protein
MKEGDIVVLVGLVKAKHLNGTLATILRRQDCGRWIVQVDDLQKSVSFAYTLAALVVHLFKCEQELAVKEDCLTVSASHEMKHRKPAPDHEKSVNGIGRGIRVRLLGLDRSPITYGKESWNNPSMYNGCTGTIIRQENGIWIVKMDHNRMVRTRCAQQKICIHCPQ